MIALDEVKPFEQHLSVLLVEDDEIFRKNIALILKSLNHSVREAENGLVGKTIFDLNPQAFDLVISDVKMPELDGIGLLRHIRGINSSVKYIMMTGFTELVEAKQAYEIGANEFLAKPFRLNSLKDTIAACFQPKPKPAELPKPEEPKYCRIPVEEFITASKLATDIYVRLSKTKYIKIAHAGDVVPVERLKTYMEKKIDAFYVLPGEMRKLIGLTATVSKIAKENASFSKGKRLKLFAQTASLIAQTCYFDGMDKDMLHLANETIDSTLEVATQDDDVCDLLSVLQSDCSTVYGHSVAVSAYACMIGRKLGRGSLTAQYRLSLAGLMHDIGKRELPQALMTKTRLQMTSAELAMLASHPQRGKDILSKIPGLPEDVVLMVAHHHENNVGTGYPYGLNAQRIHPLGKILAVAESFCTAIQVANAKTPPEAHAVLQRMWNLQERELDVPSLQALADILGYQLKKPAR